MKLSVRTALWLLPILGFLGFLSAQVCGALADFHIEPPMIAHGWFDSISPDNKKAINAKFSKILKAKFPTRTPASALISELKAEGFVHPQPHMSEVCAIPSICGAADIDHELEYNWRGLACGETLRVVWNERNNKLLEIHDYYFMRCI